MKKTMHTVLTALVVIVFVGCGNGEKTKEAKADSSLLKGISAIVRYCDGTRLYIYNVQIKYSFYASDDKTYFRESFSVTKPRFHIACRSGGSLVTYDLALTDVQKIAWDYVPLKAYINGYEAVKFTRNVKLHLANSEILTHFTPYCKPLASKNYVHSEHLIILGKKSDGSRFKIRGREIYGPIPYLLPRDPHIRWDDPLAEEKAFQWLRENGLTLLAEIRFKSR